MTLAPEAAGSPSGLGPPDEPTAAGSVLNIGIGLDGLKLGGCQINALDLAGEMRRRGHAVTFFAIADNPDSIVPSALPLASSLGFTVEILPEEANLNAQGRQVADFVRRHRLDVLHVFGSWLGEPAAIGLTHRSATALVVLNWMMTHVPGSPPRSPLLLGTEELCRIARRPFGPDVRLFEPPIDTDHDTQDRAAAAEFRLRFELPADDALVVIVSRLDRDMKAESVRDAMAAISRLDGPDRLDPDRLHLVIVGDGDAAAELQGLADRVNAEAGRRVVTMTGSLQDPSPAYSAADLVLAMGGSAIRALSFAKPVVVLGEDGFAKACTPETIGYFFDRGYYGLGCADPDHAHHLAETVEAQLALGRRFDLGAWGRGIAEQRYSLRAGTTRLLEIYRQTHDDLTRRDRLVDGAYVHLRWRIRSVKNVLRRAVARVRDRGSAR